MRLYYIVIILGFILTTAASAVSVPNQFQSDTPALASEVNANFDALVQAINALEARTAQLETNLADANTTISQLDSELTTAQAEIVQLDSELTTAQGEIVQLDSELTTAQAEIVQLNSELATANAKIVAIESNTVLDLGGYLFLDVDAQGRDVARFDGINVQITNGSGATSAVNGLGNLVVGYDAPRTSGDPVCNQGFYTNQTDCEANGGIWAQNHKSGSHNIVGGDNNSYSSYGGLLVGQYNVINRDFASVSGGGNNIASGFASSVSGGTLNTASGTSSSVSGGVENIASNFYSSVSGGRLNTASEFYSSVSGGRLNTASGTSSSVSGGENNTASGFRSSVSGGVSKTAAAGGCTVGDDGADC